MRAQQYSLLVVPVDVVGLQDVLRLHGLHDLLLQLLLFTITAEDEVDRYLIIKPSSLCRGQLVFR